VVAPCWLFGTDDYLEVPDNDLLDFGATDSFTVVAAVRTWNNATNTYLVTKKLSGALNAGWILNKPAAATAQFILDDGSFQPATATPAAPAAGGIVTHVGVRSVTSDNLTSYLNAVVGTAATDTTTGTLANALAMRVGNRGDLAAYADMEFVSAAIFRRGLSSAEVRTISDYFTGRAA
jgi:hypothetical protein